MWEGGTRDALHELAAERPQRLRAEQLLDSEREHRELVARVQRRERLLAELAPRQRHQLGAALGVEALR